MLDRQGLMKRLATNAVEGVQYGLFIATAFSAFVGLRVVLSGGDFARRFPFSLWALVACYYLGGTLGGALAGALSPLGRRLGGRIMVGVLVGPVVASFFFPLVIPRDQWAEKLLPLSIVMGAFVGGIAGAVFWNADQRWGAPPPQ